MFMNRIYIGGRQSVSEAVYLIDSFSDSRVLVKTTEYVYGLWINTHENVDVYILRKKQ